MIDQTIDSRLSALTESLANAYITKNRAEEDIKRIEAAYTELQNLKEQVKPKPPAPPERSDIPTTQGS